MTVKQIILPGFKENFKIGFKLLLIIISAIIFIVLLSILSALSTFFLLLFIPLLIVFFYFAQVYVNSLYINTLLGSRLNTKKVKLSGLCMQTIAIMLFSLIISQIANIIIAFGFDLLIIDFSIFFAFFLITFFVGDYLSKLFVSMFYLGFFKLQLEGDKRFTQPFVAFINDFKQNIKNLYAPILIFTAIYVGISILSIILFFILLFAAIVNGSIFLLVLALLIAFAIFLYLQIAYMQLLANLFVTYNYHSKLDEPILEVQ